MTALLTATTVGAIVAADFRTAEVFERFGIDFCCGGGQSLADACYDVSAEVDDVLRALEALPPQQPASDDVTEWPVDRLAEHIVTTHHAYVREALPTITRYLAKLVDVHGARHPELQRVASHFERLGGDLELHMMKEEQVLFPYVMELAGSAAGGRHVPSPFGTVENPIRMMRREHREAADELDAIRTLTNGYAPPEDGCTTYRVCLSELQRFEQDLHRHVHLENNVLFPKAIALENGYSS